MGGSSSRQIVYAEFVGEEKKGETRALRHPSAAKMEKLPEADESMNTIWKAFEHSVKVNGNRPFLGTRKCLAKDKYGEYEWKTYSQINEDVQDFAAGISLLNFLPEVTSAHDGKFKFLGLYAKNREEWIVADLAAHLNGATVVTFYDTLGESTIEFILTQTNLTSLVLEGKCLKKILHLKEGNKSGNLENIVLLDVEDESELEKAVKLGFKVYKYPEILAKGKNQQVKFTPATAETIATFCYTSGTTGNPKGAMISHKGILTDSAALKYTDLNIYESDVHISYLPLAHIFERVVFSCCIASSASVGFFNGNALKLFEDAQMLKPTLFVGVPRIFNKIYEVITGGMAKLPFLKRFIAQRAVASKLANYRKDGSLTHRLWDRLVFNKSKAALGGRVRVLVTGSAPIAVDVLEFLKINFCASFLEGYGATETCAGGCVTLGNDPFMGHVGGPVPSVEIKLIDCPGLDYLTTDKDENGVSRPRGEILFRGHIVFNGYFNDKTNTENSIDKDGWYHTGDVGAILTHHGKALKIIDRVKNIFKLAQGEYIAPEKLENVLLKSKYVAQIFVHGDSLESYLVAVVVPKKDDIAEFLTSKGVQFDKDMIQEHFGNKELLADVQKEMEALGRRSDFKGFEVIKKVTLINEPFTLENNLLTPTMKMKRNEAAKKFSEEIKKMYQDK